MTVLRKIAVSTATAAVAVSLAAAPAMAAVTFDPATGKGFVGKGDVQLALGWNNSQLQQNAGSLLFTSTQPASQAWTQEATQAGTQDAAQSATRTVSCTVEQKKQTFVNNGFRLGSRDGSRSGTRAGSRPGTLSGSLSYNVSYEVRKQNQITGFTLTGYFGTALFSASGSTLWGDLQFEDWALDGTAWVFDETEWGGWQAEPGENPADCLRNDRAEVTDLVDVTVYGDVVEGDITPGDVTLGVESAGAVSPTGAAQLFVNGIALN